METLLALSPIDQLADGLGIYGFELRAWLAVVLVCLSSGFMGSLVVGNRMAFFSDAMSHCALAGIGLGTLVTSLAGGSVDGKFDYLLPPLMVVFGVILGLAISYVRDRTELGSDTVIGVFFAGAIGLGAMIVTALQKKKFVNSEALLFGSPLFVKDYDLLYLAGLLIFTSVVLYFRYNAFLLATFNPSLARSRGINIKVDQAIFIILLAMIVNLCICTVGMLLINAMLIVPAACAGNLARNMRQYFWYSVAVSLACGVAGLQISKAVEIPYGNGDTLQFGPSGMIICCCVATFFFTLWMRRTMDRTRSLPVKLRA
jgi:zinc transport system permease protein